MAKKKNKEITPQKAGAKAGKAEGAQVPAGAAQAASAGGEGAANPERAGQSGASAPDAPNGAAASTNTTPAAETIPPVRKRAGGSRDAEGGKVRLRVHSKTARRFRAGLAFGPQPTEVEVSAEVSQRLQADRELVVELVTEEGEQEAG